MKPILISFESLAVEEKNLLSPVDKEVMLQELATQLNNFIRFIDHRNHRISWILLANDEP